jgi:hypothetical protein
VGRGKVYLQPPEIIDLDSIFYIYFHVCGF